MNEQNSKNKEVKVSTNIKIPANVNPSEILDMIYNLCKEKGWQCLGGGVQYPDEKLPITEIKEGVFYHGSPLKLDYVKAGCDITPYKELAMAFSHKPMGVSIINEVIIHNGIQDGYLYIIDEEIDINTDIIQHPNSSFEKGYEMLTQRDLKLKLISEVKISNVR